MIATILGWAYITFLSWTWGISVLLLFQKIGGSSIRKLPFSIVCLTGISAITITAGLLSLFIPLGSWQIQLIFLLPSFFIVLNKNVPGLITSLKTEFSGFHVLSWLLLSIGLLLILVMSSWIIVHPDTLGYHAQTMQWIEKYKAIPGLVHLHVRFGYQGLWFVSQALFDFSFLGKQGITFLNSSLILWFLVFLITRINFNFFRDGKKIYGFLWIGLLGLSMWSYTQIRLTVTSASPDFIATLFVLAVVYISLVKVDHDLFKTQDWLLPSFLSVVAVTIKLSVLPIILIPAAVYYLFLMKKKIGLLIFSLFLSLLSLVPFIGRNILTSGYIVFPSTLVDFFNFDWKYGHEATASEKNYIAAYARRPDITTRENSEQILHMNLTDWIPAWWQHHSLADKTILILLFLSILFGIIKIRKIYKSGFPFGYILLTLLMGVIFWFIYAPDPRFGFGPILGIVSTIVFLFSKDVTVPANKNVISAIMIAAILILSVYTIYRFKNFFESAQLITPLGIEKKEFRTFECNEINMNAPIDENDFGIIPVPCTGLDCENFVPRGNTIIKGFRTR